MYVPNNIDHEKPEIFSQVFFLATMKESQIVKSRLRCRYFDCETSIGV